MNELITFVQNNIWVANGLLSGVLVLVVVALQLATNLYLNSRIATNELRLRWKVRLRNLSFILILVGLFVIWGSELRTLAISLVAVAVALILATKELIMCVLGSFFKVVSGSFSIGDQIIVEEYRGQVINQTLLSTTLIEIGPGKEMHQQTGRSIVLPNSLFITAPVINESFRQDYVLHGFSIPIKLTAEWKKAEELLLGVAKEVCEPFYKDARKQLVQAARKMSVGTPNIEPRVSVRVGEPDKITLITRVPAPVRKRGRIEQEIVQKFLTRYYTDFEHDGDEQAPEPKHIAS